MTILFPLDVGIEDKHRSHAYNSRWGASSFFFWVLFCYYSIVTKKLRTHSLSLTLCVFRYCFCVFRFFFSSSHQNSMLLCAQFPFFFLPERTFHGQIEMLPNFNIFDTHYDKIHEPWRIQRYIYQRNGKKKMSINVHGHHSTVFAESEAEALTAWREEWVTEWTRACVCVLATETIEIMNIKLLFKSCHSNRITISIGSKFCVLGTRLLSLSMSLSHFALRLFPLYQTTSIRAPVHIPTNLYMLPVFRLEGGIHIHWWHTKRHTKW